MQRTPMYARGMQQFYVNEVSQLSDGRYVLANAWIIRGGELCADCRLISVSDLEVSHSSLLIVLDYEADKCDVEWLAFCR